MTTPNYSLPEGLASNRPPLFSGTNFSYWKPRMTIHVQSNDYECWIIICNGPKIPTKTVDGLRVPKPEDEWDESDTRIAQINVKATNMLYCALDANEFNKISTCKTAKDIWNKLIVTLEGTEQVKESRVS